MKIYKSILLFVFTLLFVSCSNDDDNPTETQSPLNGNWEISQSVTGGSSPYSLDVNLNLTFSGNVVSGSGTIIHSQTSGGTTFTVTLQNSISGSYSDPNINITLSNSSAGSSFTYNGTWNTKNVNFTGTVTINDGNEVSTYESVSLFKNN